jgi:hypothetical protein
MQDPRILIFIVFRSPILFSHNEKNSLITGPIVYIVGCQLPLSRIGVLILKLDLSEVED